MCVLEKTAINKQKQQQMYELCYKKIEEIDQQNYANKSLLLTSWIITQLMNQTEKKMNVWINNSNTIEMLLEYNRALRPNGIPICPVAAAAAKPSNFDKWMWI